MFQEFIGNVIDELAWAENASDAMALPYRTWFNVHNNVITLGWQLSIDFC